jgi:hypothetical protein
MLFYVDRCAFVKEYLYHYRIHPTSTMNTRNAPWLMDRLRIECMVLDDIATRGFNGRLTEAIEHQFMKMYLWNTIQLWELRSDGDFPVEVLREMRLEVRRRFPNFRSNPYHRRFFSWEARLLIDTIMISPRSYSVVSKLFRQKDRVARHLLGVLRKNPAMYRRIRATYRRLRGRA